MGMKPIGIPPHIRRFALTLISAAASFYCLFSGIANAKPARIGTVLDADSRIQTAVRLWSTGALISVDEKGTFVLPDDLLLPELLLVESRTDYLGFLLDEQANAVVPLFVSSDGITSEKILSIHIKSSEPVVEIQVVPRGWINNWRPWPIDILPQTPGAAAAESNRRTRRSWVVAARVLSRTSKFECAIELYENEGMEAMLRTIESRPGNGPHERIIYLPVQAVSSVVSAKVAIAATDSPRATGQAPLP